MNVTADQLKSAVAHVNDLIAAVPDPGDALTRNRREALEDELTRLENTKRGLWRTMSRLKDTDRKLESLQQMREHMLVARSKLQAHLNQAQAELEELRSTDAKPHDLRPLEVRVQRLDHTLNAIQNGWQGPPGLGGAMSDPPEQLLQALPPEADWRRLKPMHHLDALIDRLEQQRAKAVAQVPDVPEGLSDEALAAAGSAAEPLEHAPIPA